VGGGRWAVGGGRWAVFENGRLLDMHVNSFRELDIYQLARELSVDIFRISKSFPNEEMYSLTDQVRRSSRSVGAQIAEAWAKRRYKKHFISKLTDADGEQLETQHWIETAVDCGYLNAQKGRQLLDRCASIGRMLNSMMIKADQFCTTDNR
jgi:four helix bundle protein